ncbi:probable beta-tubulin polyglutamylase isoform X3 [Plodia interpunctella]|uniref:probable beta-tubulin polyglutamylase isoform X3 n=1 Tax=Plodia interpunctella TaxID=58824 RepID=UPI002367888B|nr:probable beta-tubulin polyglutamylase isoform X3 [Plodia interpunctella]
MGIYNAPHVSSENPNPSTSGLQTVAPNRDSMRKNEDECKDKENEGAISDWVSGGPIGSKAAVLVFRSCVLASRTPSMESTTKTIGNNTGTTILLNKAKNMAKRLVAEPHSFSVRPKTIMHDVMETFGTGNKFSTQAYVVRHVSNDEMAETEVVEEQGHEPAQHKRDIEDVLNDLSKITLKKHLNIENTTANIKPPEEPPPPPKDQKEEKKAKKSKSKNKKKNNSNNRPSSPMTLDSDDSEHLLVKEVDSVKYVYQVLDSSHMPARLLKVTYKLVNTETKLLHRLLQAHGLQEACPDSKDFNLLWSGLHPKPDVLRSLAPYQRVNHFPRSYELTRKDKLFKNIEKMQYFRGLKHFDFVPTTFLMPAEYKELCSTHYRTKGPWIVKPAASSRGRGIYIVNTPEQIPKGENVVVAKYIDKPLLIGGHKCDLRLYVCMTSIDPLLIYLYEEGLVRFATVKYDKTNKNLWNPCMHLCNYSINKYHTDYIKCDDPNAGNIGHKWTLSALLRHLRKQGRNTTALMAAIEDLVVKSILSSAQTITAAARVFVPNFFNCFELFGYDILIDEMLKPWLLEINLSPSLACESPLDARVKSALLADTLTLVGLPAVGTKLDVVNNSLKMRIGACRRVHSAENVCVTRKPTNGSGSSGPQAGAPPSVGANGAALTGEEMRLVRAVRAQYARRGGFVRIFPSQNSWQKYSQYLDPVCGVPVCSTSLNNNAPYNVVQHNYNLLVHTHVLPHFQNALVATSVTDTPQRLKRYEAVTVTSTAPAITLEQQPPPATQQHLDTRRAKDLVKHQLMDGLRLTMGEGRRAFGLFLTYVLKRISSPANELAVSHAALVLKFLKRACSTLRMPYNVKTLLNEQMCRRNLKTYRGPIFQYTTHCYYCCADDRGPPVKMCDKDRCAVIAKQLNDFLYMYYRETDLYTDSEDKEGCVSNIHFAQFLYSASEADLEDVLLLLLRIENQITTFLGDTRNPFCVDLPPSKLAEPPTKHTLLKHLACLSPVNTRRYRPSVSDSLSKSEEEPSLESAESPAPRLPPFTNSDIVLKESLKEEKPLNMALKYARS